MLRMPSESIKWGVFKTRSHRPHYPNRSIWSHRTVTNSSERQNRELTETLIATWADVGNSRRTVWMSLV